MTPYVRSGGILPDINQIIPTHEAEDYMIKMSSKDNGEKGASAASRSPRMQTRLEYWEQLLRYFQEQGLGLYSNTVPSDLNYLRARSSVSGCVYDIVSDRQSMLRVDFTIMRPSRKENKQIFDFLHDRKGEVEGRFGDNLRWERLDDKSSSCVQYLKNFDIYEEDNWPEINQWLLEHVKRMEAAFNPVIPDIQSMLR